MSGAVAQPARETRSRSVLRWIFRDRRTGRIVIAQRPNIPLIVWFLALVTSWFLRGTAHTVVSTIATVALGVWAADELVRGVNPWRRALGAVVLVAVVVTAL